MIKGIFQFIKSKTFLKHLLIYIGFLSLLIGIVLFSLSSFTHHGKVISVPDFSGLKLSALDKFVAEKNLRYLVIDSIYNPKAERGSVVMQEPEPNSEVKEGRIIYLYVTSILPPSIQMPKLIDRSLRQAVTMITTYGLKMAPPRFVADQCANCVLDQLVKGKKIAPGEMVEKGTVIQLVVGKGLSDEEVGVPCLYGLTRKEATEKLAEASLSVGFIKFDEPKDSLKAKVYRQSPSCGKETSINMGSSVDLFFTAEKDKIPSMPVDSGSTAKTENFDD